MKKLIIITGMSGSGKTTLAKYTQYKIENSEEIWKVNTKQAGTINKQEVEKVNKQKAETINEQEVEKVNKQKVEIINRQEAETINKQKTETINKQEVEKVNEQETEITEKIQKTVTLITLDNIFETICDTIGFKNRKGKERNCTIAKNCVKEMIKECMKRKDEIIIVDYPFESSWENFFTKVSNKYDYDVLTVKLYGENFEKQWERTCKRDLSKERHVMHESPSYNPKDKAKLTRHKQSKEELKQIYESESKTKISVGKEIKIINKNEKSIEEAFNEIIKLLS